MIKWYWARKRTLEKVSEKGHPKARGLQTVELAEPRKSRHKVQENNAGSSLENDRENDLGKDVEQDLQNHEAPQPISTPKGIAIQSYAYKVQSSGDML